MGIGFGWARFFRSGVDPDLHLLHRQHFLNRFGHMSKRPPQDHQGNPLRPSELDGLMRANAEALFQDMLGKNFGSAFKNTHHH
jgi:hypothetical protein